MRHKCGVSFFLNRFCIITTWGELSSEYGASCLLNMGRVVMGRVFNRASCLWGELSCFHYNLHDKARYPPKIPVAHTMCVFSPTSTDGLTRPTFHVTLTLCYLKQIFNAVFCIA